MKIKHLLFSIFIGIMLVITSCNSSNKKDKAPTGFSDQVAEEFREVNKRVNEIYYRFPTPDEMFTFVNNEGLTFNSSLLNPIENKKLYIDSKSQTLNLGVYIADLGYITLFEKYKESMNYFDVIREISERIRITSAFDKSLLNRIENNLKNVDSLKTIANDAYSNVVDYLVENEKEKTFAVISLGAYVEFLYISLNLVGDYDKENSTIQRIAEQKYAFENLYFYIEEFQGDPLVDDIFTDVKELKSVIDQIGEEKQTTQVTKSEDGKLNFDGGNKIAITKDQYNKLKDITGTIRTKITESKQ